MIPGFILSCWLSVVVISNLTFAWIWSVSNIEISPPPYPPVYLWDIGNCVIQIWVLIEQNLAKYRSRKKKYRISTNLGCFFLLILNQIDSSTFFFILQLTFIIWRKQLILMHFSRENLSFFAMVFVLDGCSNALRTLKIQVFLKIISNLRLLSI
mgnify:CR=1 FL=1